MIPVQATMTDMDIKGISVLSRMDCVFSLDPIMESILPFPIPRNECSSFDWGVLPATFLSSRNAVRPCVDLQTKEMTIRVKTRGTSY